MPMDFSDIQSDIENTTHLKSNSYHDLSPFTIWKI